MTISSDLDLVQAKLHDNATLWTRAELLRWYQDGYREMLAKSRAVRRLYIVDMPPRYAFTYSHEWESRHVQGGPSRMMLLPALDTTKRVTALWEAEHLEGVSTTNSEAVKTQEWERAFGNSTDQHFVFALPKNTEQILHVSWDNKRLLPVSVRELDANDDAWMTRVGEPDWWTPGTGRIDSIEIYEIETSYNQQYVHVGYEQRGLVRRLTGDRTYATSGAALENGYAYTTSGDAQATSWHAVTFAAKSAHTDQGDIDAYYAADADLNSDFLPTFQWTLSSVNHTRKVTQAWEQGDGTETGEQLGQWPWAGVHGSKVPLASESPVGVDILTGIGWRFTQDAVNDFHGTQVWEKEMQEGMTSDFTDGSTIGTYWWESMHNADFVSFSVGTIRGINSPNRQYLAMGQGASVRQMQGGIRGLASTVESVAILHAVIPVANLGEADTPDMVPSQLQKHLRYFVWARAFGHSGPAQNLGLAAHYRFRFEQGVRLLRRMGTVTHLDHVFVRQEIETDRSGTPGRVRLPSDFPAVF